MQRAIKGVGVEWNNLYISFMILLHWTFLIFSTASPSPSIAQVPRPSEDGMTKIRLQQQPIAIHRFAMTKRCLWRLIDTHRGSVKVSAISPIRSHYSSSHHDPSASQTSRYPARQTGSVNQTRDTDGRSYSECTDSVRG